MRRAAEIAGASRGRAGRRFFGHSRRAARPIALLACLALLLAAWPSPVSRLRAAEADLAQLVAGVGEIAAPGVPGPLCVFGEGAFPVVVGGAGADLFAPVVAAGRLGAGRVLAFGHDGYFGAATIAEADTGRLLANAVRWAGGQSGAPTGGLRVGVLNRDGLLEPLRSLGFEPRSIGIGSLGEVDVVLTVPWASSEADLAALEGFVRQGGGLVAAVTGWGWQQLTPSQRLAEDFVGNRLLAPAGIAWADAYLQTTAPAGYAVAGAAPGELTHAGRALDAAIDASAGRRQLSEAERRQAVHSVTEAVRCVPSGDRLLLPRVEALAADPAVHSVPSPDAPIGLDNLAGRILLILQDRRATTLPPESVRAHPAAAIFPGAVPADAPRVTRSVWLDPAVPRWHSTGLYAAPGEPIVVRVPPELAGAELRLRIGAHSDQLWHLERWRRVPRISFDWPLAPGENRMASAFGGLVYVDVVESSGLGAASVEIAGAVEAPRYVHGVTRPEDWPAILRERRAPWGELGSDKLVVTVPREVLAGLDDPAALMDTWDRVMDLNADLATSPRARERPERIVPDEQISAGYMHAGYPIMTHLDVQAQLADRRHIAEEGNWGFFHEIGHNHQSGDWTFEGTGEVTVNLFTLYVFEHLCGVPTVEHPRASLAFQREQMARYDFDRPDFEQWKREPFLALVMYIQLQQAFGWQAYRDVFAEYRALPEAERPRSDADKRDQWLLRFSRRVGRNLGPFFQAWGVPTSAEARAQLVALPVWMPEDFPPGTSASPTPTRTTSATPSPTPLPASATPVGSGTPPTPAAPTAPTAGPSIYLPQLFRN